MQTNFIKVVGDGLTGEVYCGYSPVGADDSALHCTALFEYTITRKLELISRRLCNQQQFGVF